MSQRFAAELMDQIPAPIKSALDAHAIVSMTDRRGTIVYVNERFCRISGYSEAELLGQNHRILRSDEHSREFYEDMWGTISRGETWNGEVKNLRKSGDFYWVASTIIPVKNDAGEITHYYSIRTDITETKRYSEMAESLNKQLALILKQSGTIIVREDLETNTHELMAGPALLPNKYKNRRIDEFRPEIHTPGEIKALKFAQAHPGRSVTVATRSKTGEAISWGQYGYSEPFEVEGRRYQLMYRVPVDELARLTDSNRRMFAVIGHELKTPLIGASMMLGDESCNDPLVRGQVKDNIDHALELIDQLREMIQPDQLVQSKSLKNVDIYDMVQGIIATQRSTFSDQFIIQIRLGWLPERWLRLNHVAVRQVLLNLIRNSAIHAKPDHIWVTLYGNEVLGEAGEYQVTLVVSDDGPGIPESKRAGLFDAFHQTDNANEGTGIGLYVCRDAATNMGGDLIYQDRAAGGAEFVFTFRASSTQKESNREAQAPEANKSLEGLRILFAEDTETLRLVTEKMLTKVGAQVSTAEQGAQALSLFKEGEFDLVLTDLFMPELDGIELTRSLRALGFKEPIIGLTAALTDGESQLLMDAGATAVLGKPLNIEKLAEIVISSGDTGS